MKKIAELGNIKARSVLRYVVDGLSMRSDFRYSLYSCKFYKELQEQYEVFDRVVDKPYKQNGFNDRKRHCFTNLVYPFTLRITGIKSPDFIEN